MYPAREQPNQTAEATLTVTANGVSVAALSSQPAEGAPLPKIELVALLNQTRTDPTFAADIAALTQDNTDDLGPMT